MINLLQAPFQAIDIQRAFFSGIKSLPQLLYPGVLSSLVLTVHDNKSARKLRLAMHHWQYSLKLRGAISGGPCSSKCVGASARPSGEAFWYN